MGKQKNKKKSTDQSTATGAQNAANCQSDSSTQAQMKGKQKNAEM